MKALILAAGYGTRLYPLTKTYPKALLPVGGRPILDFIADKLFKVREAREIIVITNDKFYLKFLAWAGRFKGRLRKGGESSARRAGAFALKVINDGTKSQAGRLGAIGDINFALSGEDIDDDLLIFGGDNLFEDGLASFLKFALSKKPQVTIGTYDIKQKRLAVKYGVIELDSGMRIVNFTEKPRRPRSCLVATCLYYIPREKLKYFREYLADSRNEKDASGSFIRWLSRKEDVYSFVFRKRWYDIGDPLVYNEADRVFSKTTKA